MIKLLSLNLTKDLTDIVAIDHYFLFFISISILYFIQYNIYSISSFTTKPARQTTRNYKKITILRDHRLISNFFN